MIQSYYIAGRRATAGPVVAAIVSLFLLLLIGNDTSMKVASDTGQGPFQAVHWALLLLDLLIQQRTATRFLLFGHDAVLIIVHFIVRLLKVWLLFRRRQLIRQSQSGP